MNDNNKLRVFPFYLFMFLASFVLVKFIFIFFFAASFTPRFIFELTPLHLLPGISNLQLIFLSMCITILAVYLHVRDSYQNTLYSFIPTLIMISGLAVTIITNELSVNYLIYYILFGVLLITLTIDHKKLLQMTMVTPSKKLKSIAVRPIKTKKHILAEPLTYYFKRNVSTRSYSSQKKNHHIEIQDIHDEIDKMFDH